MSPNVVLTDDSVAQRCEALLSHLPPFPPVALQLIHELNDIDADIRRVVDLLRSDQAFAAQLLRQANSARYCLAGRVDSVRQCVVRLGFRDTRRLALRTATASYAGEAFQTPEMRRCWRHSLACAELSAEIADVSKADPELAYTAGLLHDIGRLGMLVAHTRDYLTLVQRASHVGPVQDSSFLLEQESRLFGVDHCEAGRWLMEHWNTPLALQAAAGRHHDAPESELGIVEIVHFGCQLASALGFAAIDLSRGRFDTIAERLPGDAMSRFASSEDETRELICDRIEAVDVAGDPSA